MSNVLALVDIKRWEWENIYMELPGDSYFKKLQASLLIDSYIESEKRTPKKIRDAGRQTLLSDLKEQRWLYFSDLTRVISEMEIIISIFANCPSDDYFVSINTDKSGYFVFFVGAFLNLVHQTKDKLFRFLYSLDINDYDEHYEKFRKMKEFKLSKVKKLAIVALTSIDRELEEWSEASALGIGVALRRRTNHHHGASKLPLNEDLYKTNIGWLFKDDKTLPEYGKTKIKEAAQVAFERWHKENLDKIKNTRDNVISNLNNISKKILQSNKNIPKSQDIFLKEFPEYSN